MSESDNRLWPFKRRNGIASTLVLFIALFLIAAVLQKTINWPSKELEAMVLIGILAREEGSALDIGH